MTDLNSQAGENNDRAAGATPAAGEGPGSPNSPAAGPKPKRPDSGGDDRGERGVDRSRDADDEGGEKKTTPQTPWVLILVAVAALAAILMMNASHPGTKITLDFFLDQVERGNVSQVKFLGNVIEGRWITPPSLPDGTASELSQFHLEFDPRLDEGTLIPLLRDKGVQPIEIDDNTVDALTQMLFGTGLLLVGMMIFFHFLRRSADPMNSGMFSSFIRSPAKQFRASDRRTTLEDVAGLDQAKGELMEVVEFLKDPAKFQRLGATIPKGVLLVGPPGTGKTLIARAVAGEAKVPFFSVNGSEFIQMFVGVGASRVRDLFQSAKAASPCIIFIDEIDAVGRVRGAGVGGGHDEREQTLNQILGEMDGFSPSESVIVLAATNRPDVLDRALTRPGRFDRHITIDLPSRRGRLGILKVHTRKVPLDDQVQLDRIASSTIGFSGAELKNLVNEAALTASRHDRRFVTMADFETAADRILLGVKRDSSMNQVERRMTAYHESGHALVAWLKPELDPVHKVTIVPRGRALGVTQLLPEEDRYSVGEHRLYAQLSMLLGGRAAEKLVFDEYTAGAQDDLKRASDLARKMVAYWGMSAEVGPVAFHHATDDPFLGRDMHEQRDFSDQTAHTIDREMQRILVEAQERATALLTQNRDLLDKLSLALLEQEILERDQIAVLIGQRAAEKRDAETNHVAVAPGNDGAQDATL